MEIDYKKVKPRGFGFGVLYGLCKTHENVLDGGIETYFNSN